MDTSIHCLENNFTKAQTSEASLATEDGVYTSDTEYTGQGGPTGWTWPLSPLGRCWPAPVGTAPLWALGYHGERALTRTPGHGVCRFCLARVCGGKGATAGSAACGHGSNSRIS